MFCYFPAEPGSQQGLAAMTNTYVIVRTVKLDLYEESRSNRVLERHDDDNT
jgi:hypothetical protein